MLKEVYLVPVLIVTAPVSVATVIATGHSLWAQTLEDPVAFFTFLLTLFTLVLAVASIIQGLLTYRQGTLARDEFRAAHRGRVRIRNINVRKVDDRAVSRDRRLLNPRVGAIFSGQLYASNIGDSATRLLDGYISFASSKHQLPMERPYEGEDGNLIVPRAWIPPGGSHPILFDKPLVVLEPTLDSFVDDTVEPILALGWFEYGDAAGLVRRVTFCRKYSPELCRFVAFEGTSPDYEAEE